jgi:hypothetical protein
LAGAWDEAALREREHPNQLLPALGWDVFPQFSSTRQPSRATAHSTAIAHEDYSTAITTVVASSSSGSRQQSLTSR